MFKVKTIKQLFPEVKNNQSKRLLAIFAHPDDESINIAGLLAKASQEKIKTYLVCLTQGEKGIVSPKLKGEKLKKERTRELMSVGEILGIEKIFIHNFPDGELYYHQESLKIFLERVLSQVKPGIIITHDPSGRSGHPDHITISLVVKSLLNYYPEKINLYFVVLGEELKEIIKKRDRRKIEWEIMLRPTFYLNIKPFIDIKEKTCLVYQSQKLSQFSPINLKIWLNLFDREYFHLVNLKRKYLFKFNRFETNYLKFSPNVKKTIYI